MLTARLNVPAVIKHLGGVNALVQVAHKHGLSSYSPKMIEKWRERGVISMTRWIELMALAEAEDNRLDLTAFLIRSEP